jgi:biotin operon repressor
MQNVAIIMNGRQEKVSEITLILFKELKKGNYIGRGELCTKLGISEKTLERRVNDIRINNTDYYILSDKKIGYKLIKRNPFVPTSKTKTPTKSQEGNVYAETFNTKVKTIDEAIKQGLWIVLVNYKPTNGKVPEDRRVFPTAQLIDESDSHLLAVKDLTDIKPFSYKLSRCDSVKKINSLEKQKHCVDLTKIRFDDFGLQYFDGDPLYEVDLFLTSYSMGMIVRDFHQFKGRMEEINTRKIITKQLNGRVYKYPYKLRLRICHIGALGRMVCGMFDHIIVKTDSEKLRNNLRQYVQETVFNAFDENL